MLQPQGGAHVEIESHALPLGIAYRFRTEAGNLRSRNPVLSILQELEVLQSFVCTFQKCRFDSFGHGVLRCVGPQIAGRWQNICLCIAPLKFSISSPFLLILK